MGLELMSVVQRKQPFEKEVQFQDLCVWILESELAVCGVCRDFCTCINFR